MAACMVWLQGSVTQLNIAEDSLVLEEEGGGQVRVDGLSSSPGLSVSSLATGQYLQVVGQLVSARAVRCQKLTDLSRNKHCQLMWDLEVAELHGLLAGSIEFAEI